MKGLNGIFYTLPAPICELMLLLIASIRGLVLVIAY